MLFAFSVSCSFSRNSTEILFHLLPSSSSFLFLFSTSHLPRLRLIRKSMNSDSARCTSDTKARNYNVSDNSTALNICVKQSIGTQPVYRVLFSAEKNWPPICIALVCISWLYKHCQFGTKFLVRFRRLQKSLCRSVGPSVGAICCYFTQ